MPHSAAELTGNLHFALVDQPDIFVARTLPYVFELFTVVGKLDFAASTGDSLAIAPESKEASDAYPLYGAIVNFPEKPDALGGGVLEIRELSRVGPSAAVAPSQFRWLSVA